MGLFWSMRPDDEPKAADHLSFDVGDASGPVATTIDVVDAGGVIASTRIERRFARADVRAIPVGDGLVGVLYAPAAGGRRPGVLVIGGSDGGPGDPGVARLLASHGFAALSLAYFGAPGLPPTLEGVPMETFTWALAWMRREPDVDPRFIAIYCESRGSEAGLFTAAADPGVGAVAARSPSFVLWGGVDARHLPGRAAWTLHGKPLPDVANTLYPDFLAAYLWDKASGTPVRQTPLFLEDLRHVPDTRAVEIPVERIRGPVMLLAGADDQIWPSAMMAGRIMARLRRNAHAFPDQALIYPGVGHPIPYAYLPTRGRWADSPLDVGGGPEGMARAQADAWPRILKFLSDAAARQR
jgi:dienelactone hydrolase